MGHNKAHRAKQQAPKNADIVYGSGKKLDNNELIQVSRSENSK